MDLLNNNLSRIEFLVSSGSIEEAERLSSELIKIYPQHIQLIQYRGVIFALLNKHQEAIKCYEKVLKTSPSNLDCMVNLASSLNAVGENIKALTFLDRVISKSPQYFEAHYNKGNVLNDIGRVVDAITSFEQAVKINPGDLRAHHNLAKCFHDIGRYELAISEYDKAISLDPSYAEAWSNKGVTLLESKQYADAITCFDKAIALAPKFAAAYSNKGLVLHALKDFDKAITQYDKAISLDPNYAEAYLNKSFSELLLGRYESGWKNFEYRWKLKEFDSERHAAVPRLCSLGTVTHKKILIWSEQGLGDAIQFFRYVLLLCDLGADVVFQVPESLKGIFPERKNLIVVTEATDGDFDFQSPLLSLPLIFDTHQESIPDNINYIDISVEKKNFFSSMMRSEKPYKIGLVCSGQRNHRNDMNRSIPLHQFSHILGEDHEYFLIQKEIRAGDEEFLRESRIQSLAHCIGDFSDTAAIIIGLDCVISVDTSVIHLAGTLDKKAFLLLSFCPDWRWQIDRDDTPWYPSVKMIRQAKIDDWSQPMEELKMAISSLTN